MKYLAVVFFLFGVLFAQEMGLEEILNLEVTVASQKAMTLRESPGIVTVITQEEIANSGARDMIDVLSLVPGFIFGVDVEGVVGIGIRGNWAQEGKVLLLIDGQEFNEPLFSCLMFGNHFSVEQIKRIEIIRGPGSAIYGGYAELGVINIITKDHMDIDGVAVAGVYGQMEKTYGRRSVNFAFGNEFGDLGINLLGFVGQGNRSDRDFTDFYGNTYDMKDSSKLDPLNLNLGLAYKGFETKLIVDRYHTTEGDFWGEHTRPAVQENFDSYFLTLKHKANIGSKLEITPKIAYKQQTPWQVLIADPEYYYNVLTRRLVGNLTLSYNLTAKMNIIVGSEYLIDTAEVSNATLPDDYFNGDRKGVFYSNFASFFQFIANLPLVNFTLGGRYDKHSQYGASFVPRVGLTRVINDFHFKILYSNAFRAPGISNIDLNPEIKPEKTRVVEIEAGYQLSNKIFMTANAFDLAINEPIVYFSEFDTITGEYYDNYRNYGKVNTRGIETEFRYKAAWGYATINHSYYLVNENTVDLYEVPDHDKLLLGFPAHKITLNSHIKTIRNLYINPSAVFLDRRYGYASADTLGNAIIESFDPVFLVNVFLRYQDLFVKNIDLGIGVYDIFSQKPPFIQPYNGGHAPLPGPSREVVLRLSYNYKF